MEYIALGCMSGTSLDGIDCSLVKSDGVSYVTDISNEFIPYSDDLQLKLHKFEKRISQYVISNRSNVPSSLVSCTFLMLWPKC